MRRKSIVSSALSLVAGMYTLNSLIDRHASAIAKRQSVSGSYYKWRHGQIFYNVQGKGSPVLLLHDLDHRASSYEWQRTAKLLSRNYRVYTIDLPGCGRSDKPKIIYTAYFYVQLLKDFVKDVIGTQTAVVASHEAAPFTIMADGMYDDMFSRVILVNPKNIDHIPMETNHLHMALMRLIFLPVLGTTIYNVGNLPPGIRSFMTNQLHMHRDVFEATENAYVSAHLKKSNGKFLFASKIGRFTNVDIREQLKKTDHIHILLSSGSIRAERALKDYLIRPSSVSVVRISSRDLYPQLTMPDRMTARLKKIIR